MLALLFLVGTMLLLGLSFYRLAEDRPRREASVAVPPPPREGSGARKVELVLHLRDYVAGLVWLAERREGGLDGAQMRQLAALYPRIQGNLQGAPGLVDAPLEKEVAAVLRPPQAAAVRDWFTSGKSRPDYMQSLTRLKRLLQEKGALDAAAR